MNNAAQNQPGPTIVGKRMTLSAVTRGRVEKPLRVLLYGPEGVGKSTFAACAPDPIFLAAEDGTSQLDVARFPEPRHWLDANDAVDSLIREEHSFKTLAIDTVDWLEPMIWQHVVNSARSQNIKSIEDFGYGKGYNAALDEWGAFLRKLDQLRDAKNMHIVLLAHSWLKPFKNPEDDDYDRYELKLNAKAGGKLKEWCDAVLFARHETFTARDEKTKRAKGVSSGARVIHTTRTAAFDAKNRHDLPPTLPLSWEDFLVATKSHAPASAETLRARIAELLDGADDELSGKVNKAVQSAADDASRLARIADRLAAKRSINGQAG